MGAEIGSAWVGISGKFYSVGIPLLPQQYEIDRVSYFSVPLVAARLVQIAVPAHFLFRSQFPRLSTHSNRACLLLCSERAQQQLSIACCCQY
jgi:hypothetical protein